MGVNVDTWADQIRAGDIRAISRAITAIENRAPQAEELLKRIFPSTGRGFVIGVTGAPGTGKSTLVDRLAAEYRERNDPVGIVAVDPTSPYSGGAILGDRIRMQRHASDADIFIRSMATRGFLGGLARTTGDVVLVLDAAGKRYVSVETVGVGQDEIDIVRLADCTLVLLVPGLGDDIQSMKAGLMEIADIFVLNKADREGADRLETQVQAMLELAPERDGWKPRIVRTVATQNQGLHDLIGAIAQFREHTVQSTARQAARAEHWKRRLLALAEEEFLRRAVPDTQGMAALDALALEVADRRKDPYTAVRELLSRVKGREKE
jgi:LAO/AO transport system kinase